MVTIVVGCLGLCELSVMRFFFAPLTEEQKAAKKNDEERKEVVRKAQNVARANEATARAKEEAAREPKEGNLQPAIANKSPDAREPREGNLQRRTEIWVLAHDIVKDNLKSPSTATFGGFGEQTFQSNVIFLGDNTYRAFGFVDAQNGFGAKVRTNWVVDMKYENEKWKLLKHTLSPR
jgi:hypothetical protein